MSQKRYKQMLFSRPRVKVKGKRHVMAADYGMVMAPGRGAYGGGLGLPVPQTDEEREQANAERLAAEWAFFDHPLWVRYAKTHEEHRELVKRAKGVYFGNLEAARYQKKRARMRAAERVGEAKFEHMSQPEGAEYYWDTGNLQQLIDDFHAKQAARQMTTPTIDDMMDAGPGDRGTRDPRGPSWSFMSFNFFSRLRQQIRRIVPD